MRVAIGVIIMAAASESLGASATPDGPVMIALCPSAVTRADQQHATAMARAIKTPALASVASLVRPANSRRALEKAWHSQRAQEGAFALMLTYANAKLAILEKNVKSLSALARLWHKGRVPVTGPALERIVASASMAGTGTIVPNHTVSRRVATEAPVWRRIHANARKGTEGIAASSPSATASLW
jgi:hypothetical protein